MLDLSAIGNRISSGRKHLDLSQAQLAQQSGTSRATIDALENGRAGEIGYSKLSRILAAVGLELRLHEVISRRPTLEDLLDEKSDDSDLDRDR